MQRVISLVRKQTSTNNNIRKMSFVVDAWCNPPEKSLINTVPEVKHLFEKTGVDIDSYMAMELGPKEVVAMMDHGGVDMALLSAWSRPGTGLAVTNEKISEYVTAYPKRFVGIGAVNLSKPMEAAREAEKCIKEYGFKGIRVLPWLWDLPPTTNVYYPLFSKLSQLGGVFCTQVGHTGPMCPSEPGRPIPYIDQVALHFPDLTIVGGHIGYPWTEEMISLAWKYPNVYIDTSAYLPKYYPKELVEFINSRGQDKVLFGTNFPMLMFDKCTKQVNDLGLKPDILEKFMWKNANKVFRLGLEDHGKSKL